jgi:hypothetical protein
MATRTRARAAQTFPDLEPINELLRTPPATTEDQLVHIRALGQRIDGYVRFMCAINKMSGSSVEAKQNAVAVFYQRLATLERELGRIQENLQLG